MAQQYVISGSENGGTGSSSVVVTESGSQQQMNRRSRMETYCDILYAVSTGAVKPTHIMYKANLSWVVMKEYLKSLESYGLVTISESSGNKIYHLSDAGFKILKQFLEIKDELKISK